MTFLATRYWRFCIYIGINIDAQKFIYGHLFYFLQISTKMHRIWNELWMAPASQWPKRRRSEGSPGQRLPSADGQLSRLASDICMVYVWYIHGIYLVYPWYILSNSKSCLLSAIKLLSWKSMQHISSSDSSSIHPVPEPRWKCCIKFKMKVAHLKLTKRMLE